MNDHYLFDSFGNWIAFRVGKNVCNIEGDRVGWMPIDGANYVFDMSGIYFGSIVLGDRLFKLDVPPHDRVTSYPDNKAKSNHRPGNPSGISYKHLPGGMHDLESF